MNIISRMTGASIKLASAGSNVRISIDGLPSQVAHAVTLLYNYSSIGSIPEWYDEEAQDSYTCMDITASKRVFIRGLFALVFSQETERNGKHDKRARCVRAIVRTARHLRQLLAVALPEETESDLITA